jgi:Na+/H+ antiporter NhaC
MIHLDKDIKSLIIKRLTNLITVKSIISLSLLFVFCYLTFNQYDIPKTLESTFGYVIAFFLGSQSSDSIKSTDNKGTSEKNE